MCEIFIMNMLFHDLYHLISGEDILPVHPAKYDDDPLVDGEDG